MANFLLLYTGGDQPEGEAQGAAIMKAWMDWFGKLGPAVVDGGNPIGPVAKSVSPGGRVTDGAASGAMATGYSILKADSLDEAVEKASSCPHLSSGGTVTVYETYPAM